MKASLRWLSDLLGIPLDGGDARTQLTMLGALVEGLEPLHSSTLPPSIYHEEVSTVFSLPLFCLRKEENLPSST